MSEQTNEWANWKRRSKDSWNFSWGKEQGRGHQGQQPGNALVPVASLLFVGDSRWDIKHSEAWCITAFEKRLITLKRDSQWLLACPISLQMPRESTLSTMKTNPAWREGHIVIWFLEIQSSWCLYFYYLFFKKKILSYCPGNFLGIEMMFSNTQNARVS